MDLNEIGRLAKAAQPSLQKADSDAKNQVLHRAAELLVEQSDFLLKENEKDMEAGRQNGMPEGLLDRLLLTEERVKQMAEGLYQLAATRRPHWGSTLHEKAPKRPSHRPETGALRRGRHHLRGPAQCDGRCLRSLL